MPSVDLRGPVLYRSYRHLLAVLLEGAMTVVAAIGKDVRTPGDARLVPSMEAAQHFVVLSAIVRRIVAVARYLKTLPPAPEERDGRLMQALDRVLEVYAAHRIDIEAYNAAIEAEIDARIGPESDLDRDDPPPPPEETDIVGRPPAALVAELCRDFGMVTHTLPPEWLVPVSADLRLLCARAAAAAIRPAAKPARIGHLMER